MGCKVLIPDYLTILTRNYLLLLRTMDCIGGAIYVGTSTVEIISSYFFGNSVSGSHASTIGISGGGAIAVYGNVSLSNVVFSMNSAVDYGGDIFISQGGNVSWTGGSSTGVGGALSSKSVYNTEMVDYQAWLGGSVFIQSAGQAAIDSVSFYGGRVVEGGGAISILDSGSLATLSNIYINDTAALRSGAISVVSKSSRRK